MAETRKLAEEREYVIPLRREWMKVERYKRTRRSVKEIKKFIARHMRVKDRDESKVKLDVYLNNEVWFRGCKTPPAKVKVRAVRDGENVKVMLAEMPDVVKYSKARHDKRHKKADKKKVEKAEEKKEEKSEEEKKDESEKEKSAAAVKEKVAEQQAKAEKHVVKGEKAPKINRMALKK